MTAKREREDEMGKENDRQLCGTVKRPERKRETQKEKNKEMKRNRKRGGQAHGRKRQEERVKTGRRQRKIKK